MLSQLDALTSAYGSMEVIRLVPIPVAHLSVFPRSILMRRPLLTLLQHPPQADFSTILWYSTIRYGLRDGLVGCTSSSIRSLYSVSLHPKSGRQSQFRCYLANNSHRYGIEGIAQTYEDPFGVAKIDINMDDIVEDARQEVEVLLTAWQTQGPSVFGQDSIFRPRVGETIISEDSSLSEFYSGDVEREPVRKTASQVRFVVSDMSDRRYKDLDDNGTEGMEIGNRKVRTGRMSSAISPGDVSTGSSNYFDVV
jgi:putative membrane protein